VDGSSPQCRNHPTQTGQPRGKGVGVVVGMITPMMSMTARVRRDLIFMAVTVTVTVTVAVTMAAFVRCFPAFTVVKRGYGGGYGGRSVRLDQPPWGDQGTEQQHQCYSHGKHPPAWKAGGVGNVRWVGVNHGIGPG